MIGFSAQLAEVSVNGASGAMTVHKVVIAQSIGRSLNPTAVEGHRRGTL